MKAIWVLDHEVFVWGRGCVGLQEEEEIVVDPAMTENKLDGVGLTERIKSSCFSCMPSRISDYQLSTFLPGIWSSKRDTQQPVTILNKTSYFFF